MEAITGELRIRSNDPRHFKCWALDVTGRRVRQIPIKNEANEIVLKMQSEREMVYYELAAQ